MTENWDFPHNWDNLPIDEQIAWAKYVLDNRNNRSADGYYKDKDFYWSLVAKKNNSTVREQNPMHFWFGMQSN